MTKKVQICRIFTESGEISPSSRLAALITALTTIPNTEVADLIVPRAAEKLIGNVFLILRMLKKININ